MTTETTATTRGEQTTGDEREDVRGYAMSCGQALGLAGAYIKLSETMGNLGLPSLQSAYAGRAMGLMDAACGA